MDICICIRVLQQMCAIFPHLILSRQLLEAVNQKIVLSNGQFFPFFSSMLHFHLDSWKTLSAKWESVRMFMIDTTYKDHASHRPIVDFSLDILLMGNIL